MPGAGSFYPPCLIQSLSSVVRLAAGTNPLTPNDLYKRRTAQLTTRRHIDIFIQQIYVLNILTF